MLEPLTLSGAQLCLCCCCLLQNFAVVGLIACVKRQLIVNLVGVKQALCEVDFVAVVRAELRTIDAHGVEQQKSVNLPCFHCLFQMTALKGEHY